MGTGITRVSTTLGGACAQQVLTVLNSGGGPGFLEVYDGVLPASPDTLITTQTLLGTLGLSYPCGFITGKVLTFNAISTGVALTTGVARFARLYNSAMVPHLDINISSVGGGGSIILSSTAITAAGPIRVESLYIVMG